MTKRKPLIGRPRKMREGKRVNVYLGIATLERARKIGRGNLSEGLRLAVERGR